MLRTLAVIAALTAFVTPLGAQIAWDGPALVSPAVPAGVSLFLLNPEGGDLGALGTLRHGAGPVGLGYRFAIADDRGDEVAVAGGIDVSGMLARGIEGSEVDLMWWSGGGLSVGTETIFSVPLGVILGWTGSEGEVILSPYGGGHVVLDLATGPGDGVHFSGVVDLGLDLVLRSGWMVRVGASIGDRESLALGIKLPRGGS